MHNIAMNCKSRVGWSTAFYKDLSSIYLKDVNNHGFNQSYHDTRSWYHRMVASIECLQAPSLHSGSLHREPVRRLLEDTKFLFSC